MATTGLGPLAAFAHQFRYQHAASEVHHQLELVVRDTLAAMLAGAALPEIRSLMDLAPTLAGDGRCTLIGRKQPTTAPFAALANGTGGVSLELDEGNQFAMNHPAIHILPAALATAEHTGASGKGLLEAVLVGYEIAVRVGRNTNLRDDVHPFGTHAIVGAAAACARLLGLAADEIDKAMRLAAGLTVASSQTAANEGASVRNLFSGMTNHAAVLAPFLVRSGFTPEPNALEAVFGKILGTAFQNEGFEDLGENYSIRRNYFKMYACSRWNHAPVEAAANLLRRAPFEPEFVKKITVWTYNPATRLHWQNPVNGYAAKHSIPFNVAVRLVKGTNDLEAYTEDVVSDPRVRSLARRVEVREDPEYTAMIPEVRPARIEVELKSGERLDEWVESPRGGFDNPFTEQELLEKFRRLAGRVLTADHVKALQNHLSILPEQADLVELGQLLRGMPASVAAPGLD